MAKSYRKRSHSKTVRKHSGKRGSKGRKAGKRSTKRRSRRGGMSWADMKAKASSAGQGLKEHMKKGAAAANAHYETAKAHTSAKLADTSAKLANSPTYNSMKQGMSSGISKASSMGTSAMGKVSSGLGSAKTSMTNAYTNKFGSKEAMDAAGRSNAGVPTANQYGSPTLISTSAPTMPKQ